MVITEEMKALAKTIWDYHHVNHTLEKADCILALGSHDTRVAIRAAELYKQHWAPLVIFSGGLGRLTEGMWQKSEAELFAEIAMREGVSKESIIIENKSTNTGENIRFVKQLLAEKNLDPSSFILVQKPYMERRTLATFQKNWSEKHLVVTSPQVSFEDYPTAEIPLERVIHIMVGDLQRIRFYPDKGFQTYQEIPDEVWMAYRKLVNYGFTQQLMKD